MEDRVKDLMFQPSIREVKRYLNHYKIELSKNNIENRILFINHFLISNKKRIKKRARIRKRLSLN